MVDATAHFWSVLVLSFLDAPQTPAAAAPLWIFQPSSSHDFLQASGRNLNCAAVSMVLVEGAGAIGATAIVPHTPLAEPAVLGAIVLSGAVADLSRH